MNPDLSGQGAGGVRSMEGGGEGTESLSVAVALGLQPWGTWSETSWETASS